MLHDDYAALGTILAASRRRHRALIAAAVADFRVAMPSWGVGTGGTRFARFPGPGEPRNVFEKLEDCAVVHSLTCAHAAVSLHIPWDQHRRHAGAAAQRAHGAGPGIRCDELEHLPGPARPGAFLQVRQPEPHRRRGARAGDRAQPRVHSRSGRCSARKALTCGSATARNFPGQQHLARAFDRYLESAAQIYAALPADWRLFIEHKLYEPAFYSTVMNDWGTRCMRAQSSGRRRSAWSISGTTRRT